MSRISSYGQQASNMRNLDQLQQILHERSVKATRGGKVSDTFADFPYSSEYIINTDVERRQLETFSTNLEVAENQLLSSENNLAQLVDIMSTIFKDLVSAMGGDKTAAIASISKAGQTLEDVVRIGNTNVGGKYIFGKGSNVAPINLDDVATPNLGDPPNYAYSYVGNSPFRIKTSRQSDYFEYGVSVDTPAFETAIHGLMLMKTADPTDHDRLSKVMEKITECMQHLGNLQAQLGQQIVTVEKALEFNAVEEEAYITAQTKVIMDDMAKTVLEFQDAETQMKLSRQVLSRIARQSPFED